MRFPLILFVMAFHFPLCLPRGHSLFYIEQFVATAQVLMSIFFFMSGYLLFHGRDVYGVSDYRKDLCRKTRSILIPFVLWSAIAYLLFLSSDAARASMPEPGGFFRMFIHGYPAAPRNSILGYEFLERSTPTVTFAYWFLRDLFVLFLLSPIFRWLALRLRQWIIPLLLVPFTLNAGLPDGFISLDGLYFYPLGIAFAVLHMDPERMARRLGKWLVVPWILGTVLLTWMCASLDQHHLYMGVKSQLFFRIYTLLCLPVWIYVFSCIQRCETLARPLLRVAPVCFFMYVAHAPRIVEVWMGTFQIAPGQDVGAGDIIAYVLAFAALVAGIILLYRLMSRFTPRTLALLTGGRISRDAPRCVCTG